MYFFIFGKPGSGKSSFCEALKDTFHYISVGELLRSNLKHKQIIQQSFRNGTLISSEIVVEILLKEFEKLPPDYLVLIDGFPRSLENWNGWKGVVSSKPSSLIYLECPSIICLNRLNIRRRFDDKEHLILKRIDSFYQKTVPILKHLNEKEGIKIFTLDSTLSTENIVSNWNKHWRNN